MGKIICDHNSLYYKGRQRHLDAGDKHNGAYYYSKEIVENIIPLVKTDRPWITINNYGNRCQNRAIVFIHNNKDIKSSYMWLYRYKNIIGVCGVQKTADIMQKWMPHNKFIYLPLSIDTEEVLKHKHKKTKDVAYVGRRAKMAWGNIPEDCDVISDMPRDELLDEMSKYRKVYAVGRCAIEAKALGCEVLPYDPRYPDPSIWEVINNKKAAEILQQKINEIDRITS